MTPTLLAWAVGYFLVFMGSVRGDWHPIVGGGVCIVGALALLAIGTWEKEMDRRAERKEKG